MDKPKLFLDYREFLFVVGILLVIVAIRLYLLHSHYLEFVQKPFYYTKAKVLLQYTKKGNNRPYEVLKLQGKDGKPFYTTAHLRDNIVGKIVRVKLMPDKSISFRDYLGIYYVKSRLKVIGDVPPSTKNILSDAISAQHTDHNVTLLYQAIFLATAIPSKLREKISALGVSHLVALSGFHLTILWGIIYGLLSLLYKPLQQRWFPYRMMLLDMGLLTLVILGYYLWLVGMPPSLVRSYAMTIVMWLAMLLGIEIISFQLLGFVVALLLALYPALIVSMGFYFSVAGVYYIYLILHWSRGSSKWLISILYIPIGIFTFMQPIVHTLFGMVSVWQLLSPLLSLAFVLFYPLSIVLHIIGLGSLFDGGLAYLFELPSSPYKEHILPIWSLSIYLTFSLFAIFSRLFFIATILLALLYGLYLIFGL